MNICKLQAKKFYNMEYRNDDYVEHFVSEADLMTVRSLEPQADTWYQCYTTFSLSIT